MFSFKKMKGVWNRNKHRGYRRIAKLTRRIQTMSTDGSDDLRSPSHSPRGEFRTLTDLFRGDDFPSPPRKGSDKLVTEVHEELETVYPNYTDLKDSQDPLENEKYMKLAYAVGKNFFGHLLSHPVDEEIEYAKLIAGQIIDKDSPEGQRFHVMYSAYDQDDRLWTLEENKQSSHRIHEYEYYVNQSLLPYISDYRADSPDRVYEVFNDDARPNMEPFYQCQHQAYCFAHAAIFLYFYLQLFYNEHLKASLAYVINISRFMRNMYSGFRLFCYIIYNVGDAFQSVLDKLMPRAHLLGEYGELSFEKYVEKLKTYGPAVVSMSVGPDFSNDRWDYKGMRPDYDKEDLQNHGMLLVGIVKTGEDTDIVDGTDVHFILQNFWEDKQFVMVRRDYFRQCKMQVEEEEIPASFHWVTSEPCFKNPESVYAKPAGEKRVALSSHLLERPIARKLLFC